MIIAIIMCWSIYCRDVTNKQEVAKVVAHIRHTCPPIAGVANGAMVLHDSMLADMSYEQMTEVLRPKIDASNHLAEAFDHKPLDFFVMFSSLSAVVGNPGQSNYAAANCYMQSLARQRRKCGLAGSTFDIGRVVGIGYVERARAIVKEQLTKQKYLPISEADFHQLFAETILCSHPDVIAPSPVVTTSVFSAANDETSRPRWADDPRFSHCIKERSQNARDLVTGKSSSSLSVLEQLPLAQTMEDGLEILKGTYGRTGRIRGPLLTLC